MVFMIFTRRVRDQPCLTLRNLEQPENVIILALWDRSVSLREYYYVFNIFILQINKLRAFYQILQKLIIIYLIS